MKHLTTFRLIDAIARSGSIRSAASKVSQTPSAVQRRLQSYEDELGFAIFERMSNGVRLNAAGELVIQHIREALAETDRLHSRIADLSGLRRGHISIGCSQALAPYFLPRQVARYQAEHQNVSFDVHILDHKSAALALDSYAVDLVLVFDELQSPDYKLLLGTPQPLHAIMTRHHPLAELKTVRLRQCYDYPIILPTKDFYGRVLIDRALHGSAFATQPVLQSNSFEYLMAHVRETHAVTFQIGIGAPEDRPSDPIVSRPLATSDVRSGFLLLGQKHDRALSVAASRFAEQLTKELSEPST